MDDGLLVPQGQNATVLEEVQVDGSGFIFVPYAGRVKAEGNTPEAIRRIITDKLTDQTPDPQVQVRRLAGDGATVAIVGAVGAQGVYPIERPTRTLAGMLAAAGGVAVQPDIARVTVVRGNHTGSIWFEDLYGHPGHYIALRGGDRIMASKIPAALRRLGPLVHKTACNSRAKRSLRLKPLPKLVASSPRSPIRRVYSCSAMSQRKSRSSSWAAPISQARSA